MACRRSAEFGPPEHTRHPCDVAMHAMDRARARVPHIGLQGERDFSATRAHAPALEPPGPPLFSRTRAEVRIDMTASAPRAV